LPFLKIGVTLANFHSKGTIPDESDWLNINVREGAKMRAGNLSSLGGKLSRPVAYLASKFSSNFWTSLVLQLFKEKVLFVGLR